MTMNRTRKNHRVYATYAKKAKKQDCDFCNFNTRDKQVVASVDDFWIINNIFPYDMWDSAGVKDHLMVVPKRHADAIGDFTAKEQTSFAKILGNYDKKGYSIYARAPGNVIKSVVHQHTHLIALDNKPKKALIYLKKPRLVLFR